MFSILFLLSVFENIKAYERCFPYAYPQLLRNVFNSTQLWITNIPVRLWFVPRKSEYYGNRNQRVIFLSKFNSRNYIFMNTIMYLSLFCFTEPDLNFYLKINYSLCLFKISMPYSKYDHAGIFSNWTTNTVFETTLEWRYGNWCPTCVSKWRPCCETCGS